MVIQNFKEVLSENHNSLFLMVVNFTCDLTSILSSFPACTVGVRHPVVASRGHGGHLPLPLAPPVRRKKMAKISHFRQNFGFLPPHKCTFPLYAPHKKIPGATTDTPSNHPKRPIFCHKMGQN